ncbi:MAG: DnaJ domain-containing protein [Candidatus Aminicenantes bacterium]|nr:DnaJ domain-containing protein [Candidatus Aminicenantes bacterium]
MTHQITEEPVPLIFKDILRGKKSGELIVNFDNSEKKMYFFQGNFKYARSNLTQERLGEILFKLGKINQMQFWNIQKLIQGEKEKIGKVLVKKNILSQKDIFFGLLYQIRTIAISVFDLTHGNWEFREKSPELPQDINFNIELPAIISEGVKKIRNFSYYSDKFLNLSPTPSGGLSSAGKVLSPEDKIFFHQLSEFTNISCGRLIPRFQIPEEIFWKRITLLYLLNIINLKEITSDNQINKSTEELIHCYEKIKSNKIDHYQLFEVKNTATVNEIKEAYFSFAKKFHPDRIASVADSDIKEKANFVFAAFNKAYETLSDEKKREEYDTQGDKEAATDNSTPENLKEKARIFYLKAKTLFNKKQYWEAATLLDEAVKINQKRAPYVLLLGLSQMNIDSMRRMAEKNLQRAAELEPWNAEPLVALGNLFKSEGLNTRSKTFFLRALSINPDHPLAKKKLEEINQGTSKKITLGSLFRKKKK